MTNFFANPKQATSTMIRQLIRERYFPEIWYVVENWLALSKTKKVLEIGCGLGHLSSALVRSGYDVTCIDPSLKALMRVQQQLRETNHGGRFEQFEPENINLESESFDNIISINMLEFSSAQPRMLDEIHRLLRPGGKAIIGTVNSRSMWSLAMFAYALREDDKPRPIHSLSKHEFVFALKQSKLKVDTLKERIKFLPLGRRLARLQFPVAGCHVALVHKSKNSKMQNEETKLSSP